MPLADWAGVPIDAGLVMGAAFLGMAGSCFLPKDSRAGLALCSPCALCSSMSGLCVHTRIIKAHRHSIYSNATESQNIDYC